MKDAQSPFPAQEPPRPRLPFAPDTAIDSDPGAVGATSLTRDAWDRFRANRVAVASLTVIAALFVAAIFAPFLHTSDPLAQHYEALNLGPSSQHWFGTDDLGRDEYSRLVYGLRAPLFASMLGTLITTVLGLCFGLLAAYYGGAIDMLVSRLTDVIFAFPGFLLALVVVSFYGSALDSLVGSSGRLLVLIIVFAVVGWPGLMRFVRSVALTLMQQQFIEAARMCGTSGRKIMIRHLLPNLGGVVLVQASFIVVGFVYTEAILSIFGLSVEPPTPDLGEMLFHGAQNMGASYWEILVPSAFLIAIFLAFTFLADGLRDAFDPRSQGR